MKGPSASAVRAAQRQQHSSARRVRLAVRPLREPATFTPSPALAAAIAAAERAASDISNQILSEVHDDER
jgi:hypothetical protein